MDIFLPSSQNQPHRLNDRFWFVLTPERLLFSSVNDAAWPFIVLRGIAKDELIRDKPIEIEHEYGSR